MFSKVFVTIALVLGLTMHVQAHALIAPALGVSGTGVRKDVQQPTAAKPCGKVNIAQTLDTSTAVPLTGDTFTTSITNFNA